MKNKKNTIKLTPEELETLRQRNEIQRIRNAYIKKRMDEINFREGIIADNYDMIRIRKLEMYKNILNFIGKNMQKIVDVFNRKFLREKNDFWYGYIFKKYEIPKELPMNYEKKESGEYRFVIHKENGNK